MTRNFHEAGHRPITLVATRAVGCQCDDFGGFRPAHCHDAAMSARTIEIAGCGRRHRFRADQAAKRRRLTLTEHDVSFGTANNSASIPFSAVQAFSVEHPQQGLMRGTKSTVASLAPNGAGQLYSAIRLGAETLTIFYLDEHRALHGAVLIVPKKRKDDCSGRSPMRGFSPGVGPTAGLTDGAPLMHPYVMVRGLDRRAHGARCASRFRHPLRRTCRLRSLPASMKSWWGGLPKVARSAGCGGKATTAPIPMRLC